LTKNFRYVLFPIFARFWGWHGAASRKVGHCRQFPPKTYNFVFGSQTQKKVAPPTLQGNSVCADAKPPRAPPGITQFRGTRAALDLARTPHGGLIAGLSQSALGDLRSYAKAKSMPTRCRLIQGLRFLSSMLVAPLAAEEFLFCGRLGFRRRGIRAFVWMTPKPDPCYMGMTARWCVAARVVVFSRGWDFLGGVVKPESLRMWMALHAELVKKGVAD